MGEGTGCARRRLGARDDETGDGERGEGVAGGGSGGDGRREYGDGDGDDVDGTRWIERRGGRGGARDVRDCKCA